MSRTSIGLIIGILQCLAPGISRAQEFIPFTARGMGMGFAQTGRPDREGAWYWNPAALSEGRGFVFDYSQNLLLADEGTLPHLARLKRELEEFERVWQQSIDSVRFTLDPEEIAAQGAYNPLVYGLTLVTETLPEVLDSNAIMFSYTPFNGLFQAGRFCLNVGTSGLGAAHQTIDLSGLSLAPQRLLGGSGHAVRAIMDSLVPPEVWDQPAPSLAGTSAPPDFQDSIHAAFGQAYPEDPGRVDWLSRVYITALDSAGVDFSDPLARDIALSVVQTTCDTSQSLEELQSTYIDENGEVRPLEHTVNQLIDIVARVRLSLWQHTRIGLAFGFKIGDRISLGMNPAIVTGSAYQSIIEVPFTRLKALDTIINDEIRNIQEKLNRGEKTTGMTLDIGIMHEYIEERLFFGLTARNLNEVTFPYGTDVPGGYRLKRRLRGGIMWIPLLSAGLEWSLALDLDLLPTGGEVIPGLSSQHLGIGTEIRFLKIVKVRTGVVRDLRSENHPAVMTLGGALDLGIAQAEISGAFDPGLLQAARGGDPAVKGMFAFSLSAGWPGRGGTKRSDEEPTPGPGAPEPGINGDAADGTGQSGAE